MVRNIQIEALGIFRMVIYKFRIFEDSRTVSGRIVLMFKDSCYIVY